MPTMTRHFKSSQRTQKKYLLCNCRKCGNPIIFHTELEAVVKGRAGLLFSDDSNTMDSASASLLNRASQMFTAFFESPSAELFPFSSGCESIVPGKLSEGTVDVRGLSYLCPFCNTDQLWQKKQLLEEAGQQKAVSVYENMEEAFCIAQKQLLARYNEAEQILNSSAAHHAWEEHCRELAEEAERRKQACETLQAELERLKEECDLAYTAYDKASIFNKNRKELEAKYLELKKERTLTEEKLTFFSHNPQFDAIDDALQSEKDKLDCQKLLVMQYSAYITGMRLAKKTEPAESVTASLEPLPPITRYIPGNSLSAENASLVEFLNQTLKNTEGE